MVKINNLQLLIVERIHIEALLRSKSELAEMLQVTVPKSWPHFPEAFSLPADEARESSPDLREWHGYFFIHPEEGMLVGNGGFKGPPDESGTVEIGYEIASEYWNRGFATEAAQQLIDCAFAHEAVQVVMAHTLAERNASNRVLQKVGMTFIAEIDDPEEGKLWRWQISRDGYPPT
ncbi:GNAT family N-acetyltransferase [Leptolyngbya sp. FACHB-261]|uniref:GNAT family N-acetyltransferase n=1 Tax=Leptolyngbya sp. FACHB-261 TaxID=2692806 RepID=UPI001688AA91|nr:GNAT family N-acetyltransferase [Leptolyngbya sp. FACHB-261]MBD2102500.1 GNAT family N-acetyltransferase [Leptolyngbya sp. FACHB-261]